MGPVTPRQDRSRATRERLLEATLELLATRGWAATTVGEVARAAGVSRGAAQHHFPRRDDLVAAALHHMVTTRVHALEAAAADVLPAGGPERTRAVVEAIVEQYTGQLFKAALQAWTAAISEPELRERVQPLEDEFSREIFRLAADLLGADLADEGTRRALQTTLDLARGLGLADLLSDDRARRTKITTAWAARLHAELRRTSGPGEQGRF